MGEGLLKKLLSRSFLTLPRGTSAKDVGGYSRYLPKANGEEPADLPQEVVDWMNRSYRKTSRGDSCGDESGDSSKKRKKNKSEDRKGKSKKRASSSSPARAASSKHRKSGSIVAAHIPKSKVKEAKKDSSTSQDSEDDGPGNDNEFPEGGYKLESMVSKKGDAVPCLYHPHIKTMIELDAGIQWKVKEDSEGVSYIWDVLNKSKTRTTCSDLASKVLNPEVVTRQKGQDDMGSLSYVIDVAFHIFSMLSYVLCCSGFIAKDNVQVSMHKGRYVFHCSIFQFETGPYHIEGPGPTKVKKKSPQDFQRSKHINTQINQSVQIQLL